MKKYFLTITILLLFLVSCKKKDPTPDPELPKDNLSEGLIAYFPFSGNAMDLSGYNNHGTITGATLTADRFGNANKAYNFDGSSDYINIGNSSLIKRYKSTYSFSAWIKLFNYGSTYAAVILSNRNHSTSPVSGSIIGVGGLLSSQARKFQLVQNATPTSDIYSYDYSKSIQYIPLNEWIMVSITYKYNGNGANEIKTYINGNLDNTETLKEILDPGASPTIIGHEPHLKPSDYNFNGDMDEIRLYNRVLSAEEIQQIYQLKK